MAALRSILLNSWNYFLTIQFSDIVDIIIVAFLIYKLIGLIRKTNSSQLAKGIIVLLIILWLSGIFNLTMINFILRKGVELGLIVLVIIFQPELRKLLEKMGSGRSLARIFSSKDNNVSTMDATITQTVAACQQMSTTRTGALIVFERNNNLDEYMKTGTLVDATTTAELLKNIFFVKAPLHDGAVFIRDGRIAAAGCVLPLSQSKNLSKDLGMRHRAGIGMSEVADAVVAIVSEETGAISVAENGMLKRHLNATTFEKLLRSELITTEADNTSEGVSIKSRLMSWMKGSRNE